MYCSISDIQQYSDDINRSNVFPFHGSMRGQLSLGLVDRPRLPGAEWKWKAELRKTEEEVLTLKQVLCAKEKHAARLKAGNHGLEIGESSQKI